MIFAKYRYPLPNNGSGYSFTEQELVKLLDSVYEKGFKDGVVSSIVPETTMASTTNECVIKASKKQRWQR
jgi:hypothetical protein